MIGDPLTLEQLRGMDGQPVWVAIKSGFWGIASSKKGGVIHSNGGYIPFGSLKGRAYSYPPAHIDREALEDCPVCGKYKVITFKGYRTKEEAIDMSGKSHPHISGAALFCPRCGKSIASGARAERKGT